LRSKACDVDAVEARAGALDGDVLPNMAIKAGGAIQHPIAPTFHNQYKRLVVSSQCAAKREHLFALLPDKPAKFGMAQSVVFCWFFKPCVWLSTVFIVWHCLAPQSCKRCAPAFDFV
jgi:hypothetical protein